MINGMARCLECSDSPGHFADLACAYLRRLGYSFNDGVPLWLALSAVKWRDKRWPAKLSAAKIMGRIYRDAGWPPNLDPRRPC
jgi:hypothetical protein